MTNPSRLLNWLNQSKLQKDNNTLYQTIKGLIDSLEGTQKVVTGLSSTSGSGSSQSAQDAFREALLLMGGVGVKSSSSTVASSDPFPQIMMLAGMVNKQNKPEDDQDYVVLSDGVEPPTPISDGFGNFIYIPYTP